MISSNFVGFAIEVAAELIRYAIEHDLIAPPRRG
jgi:hypothetical protein